MFETEPEQRSDPTIFIVGGLPRTGKTLLSKRLVRSLDIDCLETDHIRALFNAKPESPISYVSKADIKTCTKKMRPYLSAFIQEMVGARVSIVINGEAIHPQVVAQSPYRENIRACFFGLNDADAAYERMRSANYAKDWTNNLNDENLRSLLCLYAERSDKLRMLCERLDLSYVDASTDVLSAQNYAYDQLVG